MFVRRFVFFFRMHGRARRRSATSREWIRLRVAVPDAAKIDIHSNADARAAVVVAVMIAMLVAVVIAMMIGVMRPAFARTAAAAAASARTARARTARTTGRFRRNIQR